MNDRRQELIRLYAEGYHAVAEALSGITAAEWEAREAPGEWCPREICHHLGDSEMNAATRLFRLVADPDPRIPSYDQDAWVLRLHYDRRPVEASLEAFRAARAATLTLLQTMTDEDWSKSGIHDAVGVFPVDLWLEYYGPHAHDHADQIRRARAAAHVGEPAQ